MVLGQSQIRACSGHSFPTVVEAAGVPAYRGVVGYYFRWVLGPASLLHALSLLPDTFDSFPFAASERGR